MQDRELQREQTRRLRLGDLEVTPASATFRGKPLELHPRETALLFELVAAKGAPVTRSTLHERCWGQPPARRAADVAICRLRPKLERATKLRILHERARGYRLDASAQVERRVLVVEDDRLLHNTYRRAFGALGVSVDFVETFATCADFVRRRVYDAYFVDLLLPGGSGAELIPMIQARDPLAPIMIVSGRTDAKAIALSASLGVPYATKPFKPKELERFVERTVLRQRPSEGGAA